MSKEMLKQADALRAWYAAREEIEGSGYHDNDRNRTRESLFIAPQKNGLCKASENLMVFQGVYDMAVVGDDCQKCLDVCKQWAEKIQKLPELNLMHQRMLKAISKLKIIPVDGVDRLLLKRPLWNDFLTVFYTMGQGVSGLPFTEE